MVSDSRANEFADIFAESADEASVSFVDRTLAELADQHSDVVVLSADLGNSLTEFRRRHPDRYYELGIAETNAISVAAGLAAVGLRPYILAFAPFGMIKCAEQIRTDLAVTEMPVTIVTRLSGLAMGYFGASHHAIEDIAIARSINNFAVYSPADGMATKALIEFSYREPRASLIRVSEGTNSVYGSIPPLEIGKGIQLIKGKDVAILATGLGVNWSLDGAEKLKKEEVSVSVYDVPFLKPLDRDFLLSIFDSYDGIVTVEEHNRIGGLYSGVAETLVDSGRALPVRSVSLPEAHLEVGTHSELLSHYALTSDGVANRVKDLISDLSNI